MSNSLEQQPATTMVVAKFCTSGRKWSFLRYTFVPFSNQPKLSTENDNQDQIVFRRNFVQVVMVAGTQ